MPTDACIYFYDCLGCGVLLSPKKGDCLRVCSYSSCPARLCKPRSRAAPQRMPELLVFGARN
jgi:hypothetical protein